MKILTIGSSGFIGQFLIGKLVEKKHDVVGLDIGPAPEEQKRLYKYIAGDILSPKDVLRAAQGVDMIIILAAKHHDFGITREEFFKVNEGGVKIILESASKLDIKKIFFYSTVAVYGTLKEPSNENTPPRPDTYYGESKLAAENLIHKWVGENKGRCVVIIRPTVIFGPYNYGNVYNMIDQIYKRNFIFVGNGDNIKSVAYVENLVDANIFLIGKLCPGIKVFNYSDEPQMTISEVVDIIVSYMPHGIPKMRIPITVATTFGCVLDVIAKATKRNLPITASRMKKFATTTHHRSDKIRKLGFDQRISTREGFRRTIEWYLSTQA